MGGSGEEKGDRHLAALGASPRFPVSTGSRLVAFRFRSLAGYAARMTRMNSARVASAAGPPRSTAFAWVLLDWAASGFSTVLITLIVAYVERIVFADRPWGLEPGVVWPWTLAVAMLASAAVAPGLSAWADLRRRHQTALLASVVAGAGSLLLMAVAPPEARLLVLGAVVVANVGFDMAAIFTGSLLATITSGPMADRLSAYGFAAGYAGGAVALVLATAIVGAREHLGLTVAGGLQAAFAFTAAWWLLFSLPAAFARFGDGHEEAHAATAAGELLSFTRELARSEHDHGRHLAAILAGSVLVLGAVQTAIAQFSSVALEEFALEPEALVRLVLLVQAVALPGASPSAGFRNGRADEPPWPPAWPAGWPCSYSPGWSRPCRSSMAWRCSWPSCSAACRA